MGPHINLLLRVMNLSWLIPNARIGDSIHLRTRIRILFLKLDRIRHRSRYWNNSTNFLQEKSRPRCVSKIHVSSSNKLSDKNLTIRIRDSEKSDPNPAQKSRLWTGSAILHTAQYYWAQHKYLGFLTVCKILRNFQLSRPFALSLYLLT